MADIKVIYKNAEGFDQEHSEAADSVKMFSFKTANYELTDSKLGDLVGGGDSSTQHHHDNIYFRETEHINTSAGAADAGKPVKTNAAGYLNDLINVSSLNSSLDHGLLSGLGDDDHTQYLKTDGTRDITGVQKYATLVSITDQKAVTHKKYVDDAIAAAIVGEEWWFSADDRAITPPVSPTVGMRILIDGTLGTATGAFAGQENKVAEWNGTTWTFQTPTTGTFISVDDEPTVIYYFGGTAWSSKSFEVTTASTGLQKVGNDIQIDPSAAGDGLGFLGGVLSVKVATAGGLEIVSDEVQVKADGIKDTMIDWGTGAGQVSAADMPIADAGGYFPTDTVEAALQKLAGDIVAQGVEYTAGVGGVTKGDLVYISAANTVLPYTNLTQNKFCVGLALETVLAGNPVKVLANDTLLTGVGSSFTAGERYYWNGTAYQLTQPSGGQNVWAVGMAKNSTDLSVEVEHIKKNA